MIVVMESRIAPGINIVSVDEPVDYQEMEMISKELSLEQRLLLGVEMFDQA